MIYVYDAEDIVPNMRYSKTGEIAFREPVKVGTELKASDGKMYRVLRPVLDSERVKDYEEALQ